MAYGLNHFLADESGQGITEYGAILAFVAVLVAVVAGFINGGLSVAVSQGFSSVTSAMNAVDTAAS